VKSLNENGKILAKVSVLLIDLETKKLEFEHCLIKFSTVEDRDSFVMVFSQCLKP